MAKVLGYPKVVIVGRTNVGKSTLFNRLSETERSIVFDREGVTRDHVHEVISWKDTTFDLIDTGGLPLEKIKDTIVKGIQRSVSDMLEKASLLLFVCDGKNGLTEEDRRVAKIIHKSKKTTFLLLNKSDSSNMFDEHLPEFYALGFKKILSISALHGTAINEVLDIISNALGQTKPVEEDVPEYRVAILGKPNAGKSSLMNLLLQEERAIVSEIAGTTREAISERVRFNEEMVQLIDTAGVRRKARVNDELEEEMVKSSLKSARDADIVILMVDSDEGKISDQELKLLFYAREQKKSIILVLNKVDLLDEYKGLTMDSCLDEYKFFLKHVPILRISCKTQKNVGSVLKEILKARKRRLQKFDTILVDELVKEAVIRRPMYHKTNLMRIFRTKVAEGTKVPTFIMYVNYPQWFGESQLRYIENVLRKEYDLLGCPVSIIAQKAAR